MKALIAATISLGLILSLSGCLFPAAAPERTSNQGGGDLVTAGAKIATENLTAMTADEVQIIGDFINPQVPEVDLTLTDDEAAAITEFLQANEIDGLTSAQEKVNEAIAVAVAGGDPTEVIVIPDGLTDLVERLGEEAAEDIWAALGGITEE